MGPLWTLPTESLKTKCADTEGDNAFKENQEEEDKQEVVDATCSTFPDSVFQNLPCILRDIPFGKYSRRERDMLFLTCLANISGCLP